MDLKISPKKKALFITHDTGIYGASRSLQTFLKDLEDVEVHLIVKKKLYKKNNFSLINNFYYNKAKSITEFYLPFDPCFKGKGRNTFRNFIYSFLDLLYRNQLYTFIKKGGFDFVHLNSLVLHPLIAPSYPFVIHVREIYDGSNEKVKESLTSAKGVIFIDESTKAPFKNIPLSHSIVLNNPIDMSDVCKGDEIDSNLQKIVRNKIVFAIIGGIDDNKGIDFIIKTFTKIVNKNAILLIVGNGQEAFISKCKKLVGEDKRIYFYGEEPDIKKIYRVSNFVLRGEAYFCIGRTIYEGLYAGCKVVIPGDITDKEKIFEFKKFSHNIYFYQPRSENSLLNVLEDCAQIKMESRNCGNNLPYHLTNFLNFIEHI